MSKKKILITGVSGLIGRLAWKQLNSSQGKYDVYGLDRTLDSSISAFRLLEKVEIPHGRMKIADMADFTEVLEAVSGVDTVVQLGAVPFPSAPWEKILSSNIIGLYNVFEACRQAGVKRIIYASSVRVSEGHYDHHGFHKFMRGKKSDGLSADHPRINHESQLKPIEMYGVSKIFGESLARVYSDVHGISCICLRIGSVSSHDVPSKRQPGLWCSRRDIAKIIELCVESPESLRFDIFYALSDNKFKYIDDSHIRDVLGFVPQDRDVDHEIMLG